MNNYKVAKELLDIKTLLELNDDPLKANQYENAALAVLALDKPIVQFSNLNFIGNLPFETISFVYKLSLHKLL